MCTGVSGRPYAGELRLVIGRAGGAVVPPPATVLARDSGLQRELLERVAALGHVPAAARERPRDLADVDVTARVHGEPVRGREAPRGDGVGTTPPREHAPFTVVDARATGACVAGRPVATRGLPGLPPELGDVCAPLGVEHEVRRAARVRPLAEVLAIRTEDLDAVVLPVAHEDPAVGVHRDAVRQEELA